MPTLQLVIDARGARQGAVDFRNATFEVNSAAKASVGHVNSLGDSLKHLFLAAGLGIGIHEVVHQFLEFEQGLVRVGKTSGVSGAELSALGDEFIKMSTRIPQSTEELLKIGFAAGQLGVHGSENILAFTETVAKLGTTGNLSGENAAKALARILAVTREGLENVKQLGSTIVQVAHGAAGVRGSAASETEIANAAVKVAQSGAPFGMKSADAIAFAATFRSVGVEAQTASTSVGRLFREFDLVTRQGDVLGGKLGLVAEVAGMTGKQFQELFRSDPSQAMAKFIQGLGGIQAQGGNATNVLQRLGLANERLLRAILPVAKGSEDLVARLKLARDEFASGNRLDVEFEKQAKTIASQLTILKNSFVAFFLVERDAADPLRVFLTNLNESLRILLGFQKATDATSESVKIMVESVKIFVAVLQLWAALKVVSLLNDMRLQVLGFAQGIGKATILSAPLVTAVLAIGVGLSSWSIGKTLYDQFADVQRFAERVRYTVEQTAILLSNAVDTIGRGGQLPSVEEAKALGLAIVNSKMNHENVMKGIDADVAAGNIGQGSIGANFKANFMGGLDQIKGQVGSLFNTKDIGAQMSAMNKQLEQGAHAAGDIAGEFENEHSSLADILTLLVQKNARLEETKVEAEAIRVAQEADKKTQAEEIDNRDQILEQIREQVRLSFQLKAIRSIDKELDTDRKQTELLRLNTDERQIQTTYLGLINKYEEDGVHFSESQLKNIKDQVIANKQLKDQLEAIQKAADGIGEAFGRAFEDAVLQAKSFGDIFKSLIQDISRTILHEFVTTQLVKGVSGLAQSFLGSFASTGVTAHSAAGDIANSSSLYNYDNGKTGMWGEAGPEAILPLGRDSTGQLGIRGGSGGKATVYQTINISTPSPDSFRRSATQIQSSMRKAVQ